MIFDISFMTQFIGKPRIGICVFETELLNPVQLAAVRSLDHVLVVSEWARNVLRAQNIHARAIIPEGFDPENYRPLGLMVNKPDLFRFLHVGKFEERKGTLQTIRCFFHALEREDAELVMHVNNDFVNDYHEIEKMLDQLGFSSADNISFRRLGLKIIFPL